MRFIKFIFIIALIAGLGYLGFRYVYTPVDTHFKEFKRLQEQEETSKKNEEISKKNIDFNVRATAAFKRMGGEFVRMEVFATAYYPSTEGVEGGYLNAFGRYLIPYISSATDWSIIPPGSLIFVEGDERIRYVDDNGSDIVGKDVDLCMATKAEEIKWKNGRYNAWIWIPPNDVRGYIKENYLKK